jgi:hypothetical protein
VSIRYIADMAFGKARSFAAALTVWACAAPVLAAENRPPEIRHEPVKVGVRGQPLSVRAVVTDKTGAIAGVNLYYTTSRDAAPYKLPMLSTGAGGYLGTVAGDLLASATQLFYYVEAVDDQDAAAETPYYSVALRAPQSGAGGAPPDGGSGRTWVKPALYTGGALALIGGAALAAGSGGGGDSGGAGATTNAGSYAGSVTTCFEPAGGTPACESHAMRIFVSTDGVVSSDSLREGQYLEGRLSGRSFTLIATVDEADRKGQIRYEGEVIQNRIAGSISGSAVLTGGGSGNYSGAFTATRQ